MLLGLIWLLGGLAFIVSGTILFATGSVEQVWIFIIMLYCGLILLIRGIGRIADKSSLDLGKIDTIISFLFMLLIFTFPIALGIGVISEDSSSILGIVFIVIGAIVTIMFIFHTIKEKL